MKSIPDRGDVILLSFDPTSGHEQAGSKSKNGRSHFDYVSYNNSRQSQTPSLVKSRMETMVGLLWREVRTEGSKHLLSVSKLRFEFSEGLL